MINYIVSTVLYIIGGFVFFTIGITVIFLTHFFKPQQYDKIVKWLCRLLLRLMFIRVETIGKEKINPQKTYIFMANHVNIFDVFILNGYIPNFVRGVELESHFNWPIWGKVISRYGNIPISQTRFLSAIKSLQKAEQAIRDGTSIIILPEGHRTKDGKLLPFMRGPFMMALKTKVDIVPVVMIGAYKIKKVTHWLVKPGKVKLVFGDIIPYQLIKDMSSKELKEYVKNNIQELIDAHSNTPN